jgi:hypothetical protein
LTTTSNSETDTTLAPGSDPKVYLAQIEGDFIGSSTGFNYTEAQREAERLAKEAELGLYGARAACDDPEAARDAANQSAAAADAAEVLRDEASDATWPDWDPSSSLDEQKPGSSDADPEERDEFREVTRHTSAAESYANMADYVADAIERGEECPDPLLISGLDLPPTVGQTGSLEAPLSLMPSRDAQVYASTDMRDSLSPDNPRFLKAYAEIASIEESRGRAPDAASERLAAVATVQSKVDGLDSIGSVVMNADATRAFITNTEDPSVLWAKRSTIDVAAAVATPVEASNAKLDQVNTSLAARSQGAEPQEVYRAGPSLA